MSVPGASHRTAQRIEVLSTILLAAAALTTAWAGYQASRWHGRQAIAQAAATADRVESTRLSGVADTEEQIDVAVFIQWVDARARRQTQLADFYRRRFSARLQPAFAAWLATKPFTNSKAERTPFGMPQYQLRALRRSQRLEVQATAAAEAARADIQRADDYVLCVVLLATSLFFAGLSTRLTTWKGREAVLFLGIVLFVGTVVWMATFPVTVSV